MDYWQSMEAVLCILIRNTTKQKWMLYCCFGTVVTGT